jgi:hypothetical protein
VYLATKYFMLSSLVNFTMSSKVNFLSKMLLLNVVKIHNIKLEYHVSILDITHIIQMWKNMLQIYSLECNLGCVNQH